MVPKLSDVLADLQARTVETPLPPVAPAPRRAKQASRAELRETLKSEAVTTAEAERSRLIADLTDARIAAVAAEAMLKAAEGAWDRAETHSEADLERLERFRQEAPDTALKVTALEQALAECEQRIVDLKRNEERTMRTARAREVYAPAVEQLGTAVQALLAALDVEQEARSTLEAEGCWGYQFTPDAGLGIWDSRGGDDLRPTLERWIAEAQANHYSV